MPKQKEIKAKQSMGKKIFTDKFIVKDGITA